MPLCTIDNCSAVRLWDSSLCVFHCIRSHSTYFGYRVVAPDLWVPNKTIQFNFSTWLLDEETYLLDEALNATARDLYYEFRLLANHSASVSTKSVCSQFLGAYAPGKNGRCAYGGGGLSGGGVFFVRYWGWPKTSPCIATITT